MARPMKFDREEAIRIATEAIRSDGYEHASVKALSEKLGISRSSFYNTFGTREALFAEVIDRYAPTAPDAPLYDEVEGAILQLIERVVRAICHVRTEDVGGKGCIIVNSIAELCPASEGPALLLADLAACSTRRIEDLLTMARDAGEIAADANIHALALALQNLMIGLNVISKVVRSEAELWLLAETTLRGLGLMAGEG
ncbi:TetR/AcrR family transcriptional regulator [Bradyrhizobium sp. WD16]|uniref:TetR/AcrR family transcriptional regulator n=1 Tax=Bradyrhizobium sp. WD16 TaxID=1521768 RepID=UPI0020A3F0BC|nr:TetR/AcrR family transcriptional regulator [Bradyrhizobium sp. WD16]UTD28881.1 hypothetical protein DB459_20270 [Bradyrhizobium sp. WD16]